MKLEQKFTIDRPIDAVWSAFQDVPTVATCLPGAEYLGPKSEGRHAGRVSSKLGPFQASFEGEADVAYNEAARSISVEGKGVDRKGGSRGRMTMVCTLTPAGDATTVQVDSDVQLSGAIAQFGRTGLISDIANVMVTEFVRNVETRILRTSPPEPEAATSPVLPAAPPLSPGPAPLSVWRLVVGVLRSAARRLFSGPA